MHPLDISVMATAAARRVSIGLLAGRPTERAASIDPAIALRHDQLPACPIITVS
jgi:hypothetical protein